MYLARALLYGILVQSVVLEYFVIVFFFGTEIEVNFMVSTLGGGGGGRSFLAGFATLLIPRC